MAYTWPAMQNGNATLDYLEPCDGQPNANLHLADIITFIWTVSKFCFAGSAIN